MTSDSRTKVQPDVKLLPCPFCGGKASMRHNYPCWVECVSCGVLSPDSAPVDEEGAAAAWNTRANMEPLIAENERLRGEVAEAKDGWHMANSTAELAMKHRDEAEARAERLSEALRWITSNDTARDANDGMEEVETIKYRARAALEQEGGKGGAG